MATLEFEKVDKVFDTGTHAVRNVSLSVADGEMMVLVGPSGCGKSTLLRLAAGLETETSGRILIGGHPVSHLSPEQRNVAMVFQNYALYPHMTVRRNLAFPLKMMRLDRARIRKRVQEVADLLELGPLMDARPHQLSGGQRQRVAMGRALVRSPDVFLMDEPLSNLDARLRVKMRREITALQKQFGTTTLFVTHDQVEAMTMGDRLAVIRNGALQQVGTPREVYMHPVNVFVAGFIGSPGMNLVRGRLFRDASGEAGVAIGAHRLAVPDALFRKGQKYAASENEELLVGLRPEAFTVADAVPESQRIEVEMQHIEEMGHEWFAYFQIPSVTPLSPSGRKPHRETVDTVENNDKDHPEPEGLLVSRLQSSLSTKRQGRVLLGVKTETCHLFDKKGDALV
jgi:multiple sugar transport system ATP-binding protein